MWKSVRGERGKICWGVGGGEERSGKGMVGAGEGKGRFGGCK